MRAIEYLHQLTGADEWFVLAVMRREKRKWNWVALLVDVDPDARPVRSIWHDRWLVIPGKHRNYDAACDALDRTIQHHEDVQTRRAAFAIVPKGC